jgi:predicted NAD/FAD-binding protein
MQSFIDPLCVSALNTPAASASGQVFLRVLQDSVLGGTGASHLLLPRVDLGSLFPQAAAAWITARGGEVRTGTRVESITGNPWRVNGEAFDVVVLATSPSNGALALAEYAHHATEVIANGIRRWIATTSALQYEAITTVYAYAAGIRLPQPMLALLSGGAHGPAQFVFDRGQLGGPTGLLAFVVSASQGSREELETQVLTQAQTQLGGILQGRTLEPVQTVVEKRATFACTPGLARPAQCIAPGLVACGDYVDGPYPATLEGAVRSGCSILKTMETR